MTRFFTIWRIALPGFAAILVGVGIGRFSYSPLLPVLVGEGWVSAPQAASVGAGNMVGYLLGALLAQRLAARIGVLASLRGCLLLCVGATLACILPWGFWWLALCRFVIGAGGAVLMVLGAPLVVATAPPRLRGGVSGAVFTGVGLGMALAGIAVPYLAAYGVASAWLGLSVVTALAAVLAWRGWPTGASRASRVGGIRWSADLILLMGAYAADAVGFMPHAIFWVDFVARGLGKGVEAGGQQWILFGLAAAIGALFCGKLADRIGFGKSLLAGFVVKTFAVLLPLVSTGPIALACSSLLVGALVPGIAALTSGAALELLGPAAHPPAWRWLTVTFSVAAAAGGYLFSWLYAISASHLLLFAVGGAVMGLGGLLSSLIVLRAARPGQDRG